MKQCGICKKFEDYFKRVNENEKTKPINKKNISTELKLDKSKDLPLDIQSLGRSTWSFLHTVAAYYPIKPTLKDEKYANQLMESISNLYPCPDCADELKNKLKSSKPDTSSQKNFSMWIKNSSDISWFKKGDSQYRNDLAKNAYKALFEIRLKTPDTKEYAELSRLYESEGNADQINSITSGFYDAVLLYAITINETISEGKIYSNGTYVNNKLWNKSFDGITGKVTINENGDRNSDYSLLNMEPITGKFRKVIDFYADEKRYQPVKGEKLYWPGLSKPPDTPKCGFDGTKCPYNVYYDASYEIEDLSEYNTAEESNLTSDSMENDSNLLYPHNMSQSNVKISEILGYSINCTVSIVNEVMKIMGYRTFPRSSIQKQA
ncbi:Mitochondrial FAD-linked sulfhydryl oxidase erv1, partial [Intoshia linei]